MDNSRPYDPQPRPKWWNENAYCEYHQNKGHKTSNCIILRHKIQELIDDGDVVVGGHNKNSDHKALKEPSPTYKKGFKLLNQKKTTRSTTCIPMMTM